MRWIDIVEHSLGPPATERQNCAPACREERDLPRYFFHVHNHIDAEDDEGLALPNLEAARAEAIRGARDLMATEIVESGQIYLSHWIEVLSEHGQQLLAVRFGDSVEVNP